MQNQIEIILSDMSSYLSITQMKKTSRIFG